MKKNKVGIFTDNEVGKKSLEFLLEKFPEDVEIIVCVNRKSTVYTEVILPRNLSKKCFFNEHLKDSAVVNYIKSLGLEYIILAWWPFLIKEPIISLPITGVLNFHPSYLPFNRGKHYNFWNIVEDTPFGVTIHFVDNSIDGGDIIFQEKIATTWEDTGETLYKKAQASMVDLFIDSYPKIRNGVYTKSKQDLTKGSFHLAKEIDEASHIDLDKVYNAKQLLNILRARTFPPHPGAWFMYNDERYEVNLSISKVDNKK